MAHGSVNLHDEVLRILGLHKENKGSKSIAPVLILTTIYYNLIISFPFVLWILYSYLDLEMVEFTLHEVLVASISQVMTKSNGRGILMVNDVAEEIVNETLYGDSIRLQQVLADFLLISVNYAATGGQLNVTASLTKDQLGQSVHLARLELRYKLIKHK